MDSHETPVQPGDRNLLSKHWKSFDVALSTAENMLNNHVTKELKCFGPRPRLIWEVYAGESRMSQIAETLGCQVEVFGYETGWDFDYPSHRRTLLKKLDEEMPDEVYLAPRCGLWSPMQSINALTPEKREELSIQRQQHHDVHLQFCKVIYIRQVRDGRHAHLEQPQAALSWKTKALSRLPGHRVTFDQCRYGACCLDKDGTWRLVKKSTSLQTSKRAVAQAMTLRCDCGHQHCQLEGQMPGFGRARTSYLEDYQPTLAAVLASCLATPEVPTAWDTAFAVNEEKAIHGQIIQLMTDHKAEAVRAVQRLHRNLGHPTTIALVEMLESTEELPRPS